MLISIDFETSIFNKGHFADPRNFAVSYVAYHNNNYIFKYYKDADFISYVKHVIHNASILIAFNAKFDIHWLRRLGIDVPSHVKIWDLQLAEFIYSGQTLPYDSLDAACERYGLPRKPDVVKSYWDQGISTENIPIPILQEYNVHDVESNRSLYNVQQKLLDEKQKRLVILEGEDLKTLQAAEYAGIKYDVDGAEKLVQEQDHKLEALTASLSRYLPDGIPSGCFNWASGDHLSAFLYGGEITFDYAVPTESVYKSGDKKGETYTRNRWLHTTISFPQRFKPLEGTEVAKTKEKAPWETHFYQTDAPTLQQLKAKTKESKDILSTLHTLAKEEKVGGMAASLLKKMREMHWENNMIHPSFNQNVVITGRLSSSGPNMQNQPPEIDKLLITRYD